MGNLSIRRRDGVNLVPTGHEMGKNSPHRVRFCRDQDRNLFVLVATHIQLRSGRIDSPYMNTVMILDCFDCTLKP